MEVGGRTSGREWLRTRLYQGVLVAGSRALLLLERWLARASLVGDHTFFESSAFPWAASLEQGWKEMRRELDAVLEHRDELPNFQDISTDQASLSNDDQWKTFFLYGYGFRSDANCARCPTTARLLAGIPGMTTGFFSILGPGKRLPEHRGPYKGVLRYHLGLLVPEPAEASAIRVGGDVGHWEEGKSLIFDDTYPHEAWNGTDRDRVVLFVDFLRPLPPPMALLNRLVIKAIAVSPFIQDAKRRHTSWEARFEQLRAAGEGAPPAAPPDQKE
ncbi:MAG: aspartyl/asparaginyl beta-hydroxylase domain-containing protein [Acidimicrobiales bacterium]